MQTQIDFDSLQIRVHQIERTSGGTDYVQKNAPQLSANCRKLVAFWQTRWYWINKVDAINMVGVDCLAQRVADLIHENGIPVEKYNEQGDPKTRYRLKCACHHIAGVKQSSGCYVHDSSLKINL